MGRNEKCNCVLRYPAISGVHCRLSIDPEGNVWLKDLSTNGTYVNGVNIGKNNKHQLRHGDHVSLLPPKGRAGFVEFTYYGVNGTRPAADPDFECLQAYDIREILGKGAFAVVRKCVHKETGVSYALKIIDKGKSTPAPRHRHSRAKSVMDEVEIMQSLDHPNIIRIHEVFNTTSKLFIIMELLTGGDLMDTLIALHGQLIPEEESRQFVIQMVSALCYLHARDIVHRDLKPENILLTAENSGLIKLTDFGMSRVANNHMQTVCGTPMYLAPEALMSLQGSTDGYSKSVDLWSLGIITYILLYGEPPFDDESDVPLLVQVQQGRVVFYDDVPVSPTAKDFVQRLLLKDPRDRMTMDQVLAHPWIADHADRIRALLPAPTPAPELAPAPAPEPEPEPAVTRPTSRGGRRSSLGKHVDTHHHRGSNSTPRSPDTDLPPIATRARSRSRPKSPIDEDVPHPRRRSPKSDGRHVLVDEKKHHHIHASPVQPGRTLHSSDAKNVTPLVGPRKLATRGKKSSRATTRKQQKDALISGVANLKFDEEHHTGDSYLYE
jgi:serine/threonine protein kinase